MFIVALTYVKPIEEIDPLMEGHMAWLKIQYDNGRFLASGRKVPRTGGVIFAAKMDRAELDEILAADPFHQRGVARFDVTEVEISKTADQVTGLVGA